MARAKPKDPCMFCGEVPCECNSVSKATTKTAPKKRTKKEAPPTKLATVENTEQVKPARRRPPVRVQKHNRKVVDDCSDSVEQPNLTESNTGLDSETERAIRVLDLFGMLSEEDKKKYGTLSKVYPTAAEYCQE